MQSYCVEFYFICYVFDILVSKMNNTITITTEIALQS